MAKQGNAMKILAFSLVSLFLIYGFPYSVYQNKQSTANETQMLSPYTFASELPTMGKSHAAGVTTDYVSNYIGTPEIRSNIYFKLGNVSSSYLGEIYVPVYLDGSAVFRNLVQVFSYDCSLLKFKGTVNDVVSQNISFSYSSLTPDMLEVRGNGTFEATYSANILYYLVFTPEVTKQVKTSILLDYSVINNSAYNVQATSIINIARGWTNLGPSSIYTGPNLSSSEAGTASAIGYSPSNMSLLYLGSGAGGPHTSPGDRASHVVGFGGLYRSTNFGRTWQSVNFGLGAASIEDIAVNPLNPNIVVVITRGLSYPVGGHIFKTVNGGQTWQETYDIGGYNLQYCDGVLYAATFYGLIKSYNFGSTWELVKTFTGLVTTATVAGNGSVIYVGLWYQARNQTTSAYVQILKSTNGGKSFSLIFNLTRSTSTVCQILIDPSNGSILWALVDGGLSYPNIFKSIDGGAHWELVNLTQVGVNIPVDTYTNPGHPLSYYPQYIAIDPMNSSNMYLGGDGYFYESHDGGQTFSRVPQASYDIRFINIDPANDSIIFVGSDQGLIASVDGGVKWFTMNNRSASLLCDVAVSGDKIFTTAQDFSPIYSPDLGSNWSTINRGETGFVSTDPYNSSVIVMWTENHANGHFLFVSNDGGETFFLPNLNYSYLPNQYVGSSSSDGVAFTSGATIYLPGGSGVLVSHDYGRNWSLISGSPRNSFFISISQSNQDILFCSNYSGLFESTNGGNTWFDTNASVYGSHMSPFPVFGSLAVDPENSSIIVAEQYLPSLNYSTGGIELYSQVFISTNGGKSFNYVGENSHDRFASPPQLYFYIVRGIPAIVYTCDQGIFVSFDFGKVWHNYTFNLNDPVVTSLDLINGSAYISTYGSGVWYDPSLFNLTFSLDPPLLTGYAESTMSLSVNGVRINASGYFSLSLKSGINTIVYGPENEKIIINATNGSIYFVNFSEIFPRLYNVAVTFTESGLPTGTSWSVTLNGTTKTSTNQSLVFNEPAGTYSYTVIPPTGYLASPSKGSVTVSTSNVTVAIAFSQKTYSVTFTESGLPAGTSWSVTFNGSTKSSTANSITFTGVPAGNYTWNAAPIMAVGSGTRYVAQASSGTISVPTTSSISLYYVKQCSVTIQSTAGGSTSPSGTFWYNAGSTINITATPAPGYEFAGWETNSSITFTNSSSATTNAIVNSAGTIVASFKAVPSSTTSSAAVPSSTTSSTQPSSTITSSTTSSTMEYVAAAVVVVIVILVAALLIRRK